jgi:hypothetical protein
MNTELAPHPIPYPFFVGVLFVGVLFVVVLTAVLPSQRAWGEPTDPTTTTRVDLEAAERNVFSQFGEDGVIEQIFEIIEPGPKYCVEFGAHDGVNNSNMRNLILNHGWSSFQIEGNPKRAAKLAEAYEGSPNVKTLNA